ncbi:MAG: cytochrome-c peroxidase [Myxococcaceae bacterium]|jgi:cytochrome c peroxidase|nr:cytochrome-c peroxidase [Myxococcaceae bacterium]MCA3014012.1 cytochrome-c peroxidase [Myxococcaceae bacterium]
MPRLLLLLSSCLALQALADGLLDTAKATFRPLPKQYDSKDNPVTPEKVELGRLLFFDKRLSKNHDVSCNSCHDVAKYGVDGDQFSTGHKKQKGGRNSPSVYNAGNHVAQFWDGRAATLEDQAKGPVLNPIEMAHPDAATVEKLLKSIPGYAPLFAKAFPGVKEPITFDTMAKAIGAFERTLVTPGRWDAFLAGDEKALTDAEKKGLETFIATGCIGCHMGEGVGGGSYQKLGAVTPVPGLKDKGRYEVTKKDADLFVFRVPSLRNVAKTAPYLHDGTVKTLPEAVTFMAKHQLGKELKKADVDAIVTFLNALTGELPKVATPKELPSGKDTPKPDPS